MARMTDEIIHVVRRISAELRPGILDDLGLAAAIEWQAEELTRRTGTPCAVTSTLADGCCDRDVTTAVFRIFQEALTNVVRHARAASVRVRLGEEDGAVSLVVEDDGVGIRPEAANSPRSLGL